MFFYLSISQLIISVFYLNDESLTYGACSLIRKRVKALLINTYELLGSNLNVSIHSYTTYIAFMHYFFKY